jgi:threonine dehydrogenase-like Zn-dependent dehydrogenase
VQLAKLHGVRQVIVLDRIDSRLELALRYGADLAINPAREDALARVLEATSSLGVPIILEAAGNPQVIPLAFKLAANGGRIVLTGALEEEVAISFHTEFIRRELSLIAAFQPFCPITDNIYWRWTQQENRRLALEWLASGKLRVDEMISHRYPASRVPEVYERVKAADPSMLGILIDWLG